MKRFLVFYEPDSTHGLQLFGESDSIDEALIIWKDAMRNSPVEDPILVKLINVDFRVDTD